jgi:carotenoid cleavage dioxygenase-like enzyme
MSRRSYQSHEHSWVNREVEALNLPVKGEIPCQLDGVFARNSGNPQFPPKGRYHWFDGDGMIHGLHLENNQAHFRNRYIRTRAYEIEREAGQALWSGLLEAVDLGNPHGPIKDTANTDLTFHRGRLLATWWLSGTPYEVTVPDLKTTGPYSTQLPRTMSAHPKVDPSTEELMFFDYSMIKKPYYGYGVIDSSGQLIHSVSIDFPHAHIPHDIAITSNYTLLLDLPLGWDHKALSTGKRRIGFNRECPARFGVIPRYGQARDIRWFEAKPCYIYHTICAYEEGQKVVLVACRIADPVPEKPSSGLVARLDNIELVPELYRWIFDLETGAVKEEKLDDRRTEFPRVNDRTLTKKTQFSYNPIIAPKEDLSFSGFIKYDLERGSSIDYHYPSGWYGGEVVFAPHPDQKQEDEGWVLTILTNADKKQSRALILDAQNLDQEAVAEIELPMQIPLGFHAEWASSFSLS